MIHEFNKRLIFPPLRWLNSVARWCLGVHSSDGSIQVTNTADPSRDGSLDLRVNKNTLDAAVNARLETLSLSKGQREQVKSIIVNLCDNFTILTEGGLAVNQNWMREVIKDLLTTTSTDTGTPTAYVDDGSADDYQDSPAWEWNVGGENGLQMDCYYKVEEINSAHYLSRCVLTFSREGLLVKAQGVTGQKEI